MIGEEPKKLVPVELVIIKETLLVTIQPPAPVSKPKLLTGRPPPAIPRLIEAAAAPDPVLVETITAPRLKLPKNLAKSSPATPLETITAPFVSLTGKAEAITDTSTVNPLIPDVAPTLAFEPTDGMIAVNTSNDPTPVLSSQILMPSESLKMGTNDPHPKPAVSPEPVNLMSETAVNPLIPDAVPALAFESIDGVIAVDTSNHPTPVLSSQVLMPSRPLNKAADDPHPEPAITVSHEPSLMAPDDEPAALQFERPPTIPFPGSALGASFLLLVDTSGSVKGDPLKGIKSSAADFVSLMGPKDRVALMTFDDTTRLINTFISIPFEKDLLKIRLKRLQTTGKLTVLYDSLLEAGQILNTEDSENLHIVLFSDGKDEGSRSGLDQVVNTLRALEISVLAVGFTRVEEMYLDILRRIADETGGVFVQTPEFQDILTLYKSSF